MTLRDLVEISSGNLWRLKLRAFLTTSGVVIAIAALVLNLHSLALVVTAIVLFTVIFWIVNVYLLERLGR